jgi:hypothetical protein
MCVPTSAHLSVWWRACAGAALIGSLGACTGAVVPTPAVSGAAREPSCRQLIHTLDQEVAQAGVGDARFARIDGYPYLRLDRFLAADAIKPDAEDPAFDAWVEQLRRNDFDARRVELGNLPAGSGAASVIAPGSHAGASRLEVCARDLISKDLASVDDRRRLLASAWVADDYSISKRVFGLYPFTSLPFLAGVNNLHENMRAEFSLPLASLPVAGRIIRYVPAPQSDTFAATPAELVQAARTNALGMPELSPAARAQLFQLFAPIYEIDVFDDDDRIGQPYWGNDAVASVDVTRPVVFRRLSYTRFEGRTLLQLNYSVWFPARPASGAFDLLSGALDGITLRVTLDSDGQPLLYDSMHNCGCYHLFVPTMRLRPRPPPAGHEEPPLVAQRIRVQAGRLVLRIAHGSHYLQRLYFAPSPDDGEAYVLDDDDALRSLPLANGRRRSLFAADGIVTGSERGERWLYWPMGIAEPGAMRQWGHHATAFVGTRHFDDPDLVERYFVSVK